MKKPYYQEVERIRNLTLMKSRKTPTAMQCLAVIITGGILFFIGYLIIADVSKNIFLYAFTNQYNELFFIGRLFEIIGGIFLAVGIIGLLIAATKETK